MYDESLIDDEYPKYQVYSNEEHIPLTVAENGERRKLDQVADTSIHESLQDLAERMKKRHYQGRSLILISGDGGFCNKVESLRSYDMVVNFIKPEEPSIYASFTSQTMSVNIDTLINTIILCLNKYS